MKIKTVVFFTVALLFSCAFVSCASLAKAVSASAAVAGSAGVIDKNIANAISNSGEAISSAVDDITPEQEYFIGRAVAGNLLTTYKLWNGNPALTSYLNKICAAITINSPRPDIFNGYHVAILDSKELNAFATSGGHIFFTRGLIGVAKSEDALAGVIAHEIAHIQLKHSIKAIRSSRITQALLVTGSSSLGVATGMDVNQLTDVFNESVGDIVQTMVNSGYSKTQEYDADNTALSLMASAKYDPQGLVDMLKELKAVQSKTSGGLNKTHPSPDQRISNAEKSVKKYKVTDNRARRKSRFTAATK